MDYTIPILILCSVLLGGFTRVLLGWLNSGEKFNPRKFITTMIVATVACLTLAGGMLEADIIVTGLGGLYFLAIQAFGLGFGAEKIINELKKYASKDK